MCVVVAAVVGGTGAEGGWNILGKTEILYPKHSKVLAPLGNCNYDFNLLKCVSPFPNHKSQCKLFNSAITG